MSTIQLGGGPADAPPKPTFPWLIVPPAATLILLFGVPLALVFAVSFASRGTYGGIEWAFTLGNYTSIADPLYLRIFWRSLWLSVLTTVICLVMGFPLAYVIARAPERWQGALLMLVITEELVGGFDIHGFWTLVAATLIVWLANVALDVTPGPWQITGRRRRLRQVRERDRD